MPPMLNASSPPSPKPFVYNLLWSLLQDPHMIQFPCYMAFYNIKSKQNSPKPPTTIQRPTLGSLVLSVLEEVVLVLHRLYTDLTKNYKADDVFCQAMLHPLEDSLLAKLLGTGGTWVEDLTNNCRRELLARLKHHHTDESALYQRWILEPLATRAALAQWQIVTQQSPYPESADTSSNILMEQLVINHVQFGLGIVLQLAQLLGVQLKVVPWVVGQAGDATIPLEAWGVQTVGDLYNFLMQYPPLGEGTGVEDITRLVSRL